MSEEQVKTAISPGQVGWQEGLSLHDCHRKIFLQDLGSDVTFFVGLIKNVEDEQSVSLDQLCRIPGHKFILAITSPVFEAMFWGPMADKSHSHTEVKVLDVEPEAFIVMLRYAYCEEVKVDDKWLVQTLYASRKYMYPGLESAVVKLMINHCATNLNVFELYEQVQKYEITELNEFLADLITKHTVKLLNDESFLDIQRSTLEFILLQPKLLIQEHELFVACMRWARAECGRNGIANPSGVQMRQTLGDLVYQIRIKSFTQESFGLGPCKSDIFTAQEKLEVLLHFILGESAKSDFVMKFNNEPRSFDEKWFRFLAGDDPSYNPGSSRIHTPTIEIFSKRFLFLKGFRFNPSSLSGHTKEIQEIMIETDSQTLYRNDSIRLQVPDQKSSEFILDHPIILPIRKKVLIKYKIVCTCKNSRKMISTQIDENSELKCSYSLSDSPSCLYQFQLLFC